MKPDPETTCPYTGHKDLCRKHYANCPKWIHIQGSNPNTGQDIDKWDCADTWMPFLMIENSQMQKQTGAAVESFRNEMVTGIRNASRQLSNGKDSDPKLVEVDDVT